MKNYLVNGYSVKKCIRFVKKFPCTFPSSQIKNVNELLNLFKIFSIENNFLVMGTTNKTEFCKMLDYSKITMPSPKRRTFSSFSSSVILST